MKKLFAGFIGLVIALTVHHATAQSNLVPDATEFAVLKNIYDSLGGTTWTTKTNWPTTWPGSATSAQFGTWYGVTVTNGDISAITFNANNLQGTIPKTIGQLGSLVTLTITSNALLNSIIPSTIGNLTKLVSLTMTGNHLTGTVPSTVANMSAMQVFAVGQNALTGSFPMALCGLTGLHTLTLNNNLFTGSLPAAFGNMTGLIVVDFQNATFSGEIPSSIGNLTSMVRLYLDNNQFSGSIPPSMGNMTSLQFLYLLSNQLTGPIPTTLAKLTNMKYFMLDGNLLTGQVPPELAALTKTISFNIGENKLTGPILPSFFTGWTQLVDLNLLGNNFSGDFPTSISSCTALTSLHGEYNLFTSIPASINSLNLISYINFSHDELNTIPDLSLQANKSHLTLFLDNNRLDFSQLEALPSAGMVSLGTTLAQKTLNDITAKNLVVGSDLIIATRPPGIHSTVGWEKLQTNGTWSGVNASNNDATQATYKRSPAATSDAGTYRWKMTNTAVSGITVYSDGIVVTDLMTVALNNLGYQYRYDSRKRMSQKKLPGADWVYMVYDDRDRLVLTQDGEQRSSKKWLFTKYDLLNRPVMTGIMDTAVVLTQAQMQSVVNAYYIKSSSRWGESYVGTATGNIHGYSNRSYPVRAESTTGTDNNLYLTATYYDEYQFKSLANNAIFNYHPNDITDCPTYASVSYCQESAGNPAVIGLVTGTLVRILNRPDMLLTVNYFDDKYRAIQTISQNHLGGSERQTTIFDFVGKALTTKTTYSIPSQSDRMIARRLEYDHAGRLLKTWHKVDSNPEVLLLQNSYNEIGQLVEKNLYSRQASGTPDNQTSFFQSIDYRYNIRGFLTSINNSQLDGTQAATNDDSNDLFGMNLIYEQTDAGLANTPQYNGNISAMKWSNGLALNSVKDFGYRYDYDTLNRIKAATFLNHSTTWINSSRDYNENNFYYDLNGNILKLNRSAKVGEAIDVLSYNYGTAATKSNKLLSVTDGGVTTKGFVDGNVTGDDYSYDTNGSMKVDKNKNITAITYNYLNLPEKVTKNTGDYIQYTYDAAGKKLEMSVYNPSNVRTKKKDYLQELYLEGDTLKFINHEEGRIVTLNGANEYQYFLKDHLGNVRVTATTKVDHVNEIATLETANVTTEQNEFIDYSNTRKVNSTLFDHTNNGVTSYAERLNGSANEKVGLAKSLSVMPGDTIDIEVYAKYVDPVTANLTVILNTLLTQIAAGTAPTGTVIDGSGYPTNGSNIFPFTGLNGEGTDSGTGPKAYLNFISFDRDYQPVLGDVSQTGFVRMTTVAKENGSNVPHEHLYKRIIAKQAGLMYIYLSNDEATPMEVYFDDFKITHRKSPVVQSDDYYPFGLTFNSYQRENTLLNKYLFNGKETETDLSLGWLDYGNRSFMADIGRWGTMDPLAERSRRWSPYTYASDNPIRFIDPDGMATADPNNNKPRGASVELGTHTDRSIDVVSSGDPYKASHTITETSTTTTGAYQNDKDGNTQWKETTQTTTTTQSVDDEGKTSSSTQSSSSTEKVFAVSQETQLHLFGSDEELNAKGALVSSQSSFSSSDTPTVSGEFASVVAMVEDYSIRTGGLAITYAYGNYARESLERNVDEYGMQDPYAMAFLGGQSMALDRNPQNFYRSCGRTTTNCFIHNKDLKATINATVGYIRTK